LLGKFFQCHFGFPPLYEIFCGGCGSNFQFGLQGSLIVSMGVASFLGITLDSSYLLSNKALSLIDCLSVLVTMEGRFCSVFAFYQGASCM
jgi:hypothetical protein